VQLLMAPIKGFTEAALIIGFVLIVGGAFAVLQKTEAIEALIRSIARAHRQSPAVRAALIPVFVTMFSLGGATFGMNEEAIPFVLLSCRWRWRWATTRWSAWRFHLSARRSALRRRS
jgi:uncharacterized ion transporter superfamily protein YfcC